MSVGSSSVTSGSGSGVAADNFRTDGLTSYEKVYGVAVAFALFSSGFFVCFYVLLRIVKKFSTLSLQMKADNCSRVLSTIHSLIVVPLYLRGVLSMTWDPASMEPLGDPSNLQRVICITIAYFIYDLFGTVLFKLPMWEMFALHHILAVMPYVLYMFTSRCPRGLYILSMFMLVELTNIPLNVQTWLEQNGKGSSHWYALAFYTTFFSWIVVRVINPVSLIVIIHVKVLPHTPPSQWACMMFATVCAYAICMFCVGVFCFIWCKEVYLRWKANPDPKEVVPLNPQVRPVNFSTSSGSSTSGAPQMTEEEQDMTLEDPDRMLLHEARARIHQLEETIVVLKEQARQQVTMRVSRIMSGSTSEV